jgi:hypothetical protein
MQDANYSEPGTLVILCKRQLAVAVNARYQSDCRRFNPIVQSMPVSIHDRGSPGES